MPTESPVEREPKFASRQGTSWQRKAVCEEEELGLIQRKLRSPRTFFVFVNSFWLRSSAPPPRDTSTKFSLCRTKSCTGGVGGCSSSPRIAAGPHKWFWSVHIDSWQGRLSLQLCHWFILGKRGGRYLLQRFVVGEAGVRELFGRGDFFQDSSHCAYCC